MQYNVSQMAKLINISPHTLRYYSKEGLLAFVERNANGNRIFKPEDFEWLFIIECLKKAGMTIKEIKAFIDMAVRGDDSIEERLALFQERRRIVEDQIAELQDTLNVLNYKCWYYETAKETGTTAVPREMSKDNIPESIRDVQERSRTIHRLSESE